MFVTKMNRNSFILVLFKLHTIKKYFKHGAKFIRHTNKEAVKVYIMSFYLGDNFVIQIV